ncbi:MAG TPA: hypothetical protein VGB14_13390 [Acidimicrobiales bacterium]|jgi:hypothetical protein
MNDCQHERTYYDPKGERCRDCGVYVVRRAADHPGAQALAAAMSRGRSRSRNAFSDATDNAVTDGEARCGNFLAADCEHCRLRNDSARSSLCSRCRRYKARHGGDLPPPELVDRWLEDHVAATNQGDDGWLGTGGRSRKSSRR